MGGLNLAAQEMGNGIIPPMSDRAGLSVIVITRNEEESLPLCLDSVKTIANEIVVVDSGSTDRTLDVARSFGAKIFTREWAGYSLQKQFALDKASGPWILNLDADERLSPDSVQEILRLLSDPESLAFNGYALPFHHYFGPTRLRFGGAQNETHLRLFRKDKARYGTQPVHEKIVVEPPFGALCSPVLHTSYKNIHDYLTKCNHYTTLIAQEKYKAGRRFHVWHHLRLPVEFLIRYFFKLGFLDGAAGFRYALLSATYVWLKYAKLQDVEEASE
jgi:glycosyltransferase involved in cell wall biosynthesis